jgi:hypothetical protein
VTVAQRGMVTSASDPPEIQVIDTCSIIWLKRLQEDDQTRSFRGLKTLVAAGELVFPVQVLEELRTYEGSKQKTDRALEWAENNKKQGTRFATDLGEMKRRVLTRVPRILDPEKPSGVDEADPYVLQLALQLQERGHQVTVITQETKDTPRKMSLSTACGLLRLVCLPVLAFLEYKGICHVDYSVGPAGRRG